MRTASSRPALLGISVALAGWLGCNALAGIQDGVLGPSDSGSGDATTGDGGADALGDGNGDGGLDSSSDATGDSPSAKAELACSVIPNTTLLVDDLSKYDGSSQTFQHVLFVAKSNVGDEVYVVTQLQSDPSQFLTYQVSFGQGTATPTGFTGVGNGIRLLDVQTGVDDNEALASYPGVGVAGPTDTMQIVPLPYAGAPPAPPYGLPNSVFGAGANNGRLLEQPQSASQYLVAIHETSNFIGYFVRAGQGDAYGDGGSLTLVESPTTNFDVSKAPLVEVGGTVYAFVNDAQPDGGMSVFSYPATVGDAGPTQNGVRTNAAIGTVVGAQVDPSNSSNVEILALNSQTGTSVQIWAASLAPSALGSLSLGAPQFTQGDALQAADVPFDRNGSAWMGSEFLDVGTPGDNTGGVVLLWMGPDGHAVSRASTSGKLVNTANPISLTAVQGVSNFGESSGTLVVAWIEQLTSDAGTRYERLYVAKVGCLPFPSGG